MSFYCVLCESISYCRRQLMAIDRLVTVLQTCRLLVVAADEHVVSDSGAARSSSDTVTTAGIIVIAVVVCIVVTSLVWFIVIYKSRRHRSPTPFRSADAMTACDAACHRTMSSVSDVDGSAQRLLAYGSSHTDFLHASTLITNTCSKFVNFMRHQL